MPIDKRVRSAAEALADVADGATVFITGFGGAGFPNVLIRALRERGPKDLTLVVNSATHRYSLTHELIEAGLVRKVDLQRRARPRQGAVAVRAAVEGGQDRARLPAAGHVRRMHPRGRGRHPRVLHARRLRHRADARQGGAPFRGARLRAGGGHQGRARAGARRHRRPLRQSHLPLRAGEFRPGHGHRREAWWSPRCAPSATSRSRTSACSCPASTSTASSTVAE